MDSDLTLRSEKGFWLDSTKHSRSPKDWLLLEIRPSSTNNKYKKQAIFPSIRPHLANIEAAEIDEEEEADKDNEVIEDYLVHLLTKNFLETFCMYHQKFSTT
jgi:hypothetical protein